ncbi:chemotaxis protein CheW [Hydrogenimonas thermophila]|uniref:Purine-binding chemotaxis protein CheW n=1 Tax=Hydrogenimonas thermophila TaxID=223786 RepID=A0A1I5PG83_9BACT|nr:chemotaxis protein CheW [Hydrogenimonas thermophila]WOE70738.1 chemotaxis protein CheW [Hydrogenimonas thermophila]WOE73255.1 chemotaxis protein CheW [Hydrogenimonas thermophila]SFP33045.1 purine-binding chemotaxis protein CheW [Hydrogenimonas thermophila]
MENSDKNQYLIFYIGKDVFAIDAEEIKEIISYTRVTKVPLMTSSVLGVTNIRGNVIPVIDLSIRIGIRENSKINKWSSIIIIKNNVNRPQEMGIVVDLVNEVYELESKDLEDVPVFGTKIPKIFIKNIAKIENKFVPILDHNAILDIEVLSKIDTGKIL